jgi:hypothetical protein
VRVREHFVFSLSPWERGRVRVREHFVFSLSPWERGRVRVRGTSSFPSPAGRGVE